jgi:hypothetical protein
MAASCMNERVEHVVPECGRVPDVAGSGSEWIEQLPADLGGQKTILRGLLRLCEANDSIRWLVIGCSLGRGSGDCLSDLDVAAGVRDEDFTAAAPRIRRAVSRLGDLVESYHHKLPSVLAPHERIFAQFAERCQLDLVVFAASEQIGSVPDVVVLYDPAEQVVVTDSRQQVMPEQIREWAFRAWCALADAGKYLRRGSPWETLDRLNEARAQLWQLWAAAQHVSQPQYGLTSILDFAPEQIPPGIEQTVCDLDFGRLLSAARQLAGLLDQVGGQLPAQLRAALPAAMASYISNDLSLIDVGSLPMTPSQSS